MFVFVTLVFIFVFFEFQKERTKRPESLSKAIGSPSNTKESCATPELFTDNEDMATPDYKTCPLISVELFSDEEEVIKGIAKMEISSYKASKGQSYSSQKIEKGDVKDSRLYSVELFSDEYD